MTNVGADANNNTILTYPGGTVTLSGSSSWGSAAGESWFVTTVKAPQIVKVETFQEDTFHQGALEYFRLNFTDPDNDAIGFGFRGISGAGWAPEERLFTDPSYGRVSPGQVEYPFNVPSGTASDVAAYIFDAEGNRSPEAPIHLVG